MLAFLKRHKIVNFVPIILFTIIFFVSSLAFLALPYFTKLIVDYAINPAKSLEPMNLLLIVLAIFVIQMVLVFYVVNYLTRKMIFFVYRNIIKRIFKKSQDSSYWQYDELNKGYLLNLYMNDSSQIANNFINVVSFGSSLFLQVIVVFIILFNISFDLTKIVFFSLPIYAIISYLLIKKLQKINENRIGIRDELFGKMQNFLPNIPNIKLFHKEKFFLDNFLDTLNKWNISNKKFGFYDSISRVFPMFLSAVIPLVILYKGAYYVENKIFTIGTLTMFVQYSQYLFEPISNIVRVITTRGQAKPFLNRVDNFLSVKNEIIDHDKLYGDIEGIKLTNSVITNKNGELLYEGSLRLPERGFYVIKGGNGVGKSTLLKIIYGVYSPNQIKNGSILISNKFKDKKAFLRYPLFFFEGSVKENAYLLDDSNRNKELFTIKDWDKEINVMPLNLSSGEAQKIALLRTLKDDFSLLLLDEPATNLEVDAISSLKEYIRNNKTNKLIIAIMHDDRYDDISDGIISIKDKMVSVINKKSS